MGNKITGTAGGKSNEKFFTITVTNSNQPPTLSAIADQTINENSSITQINAEDTSGGDTDPDGETITYTCVYDTTIDAAVGTGTNCTSLPGTPSFTASTGVFNWTTDYDSAGTYEFKITGTSGSDSDDEIFAITINNVDRLPSLPTISGQTVNENSAITQVNVDDTSTGNDTDIDGETINYTCFYDNTNDSAVSPGTDCGSLPGTATFTGSTGVLDWTPDYTAANVTSTYESGIHRYCGDRKCFDILDSNC